MKKNIIIGLGVLLAVGLAFGAYKFLTLEDFEFDKDELQKTEITVTNAIKAYHQGGWEGITPFMLPEFVNEYSAEELDKVMKFLVPAGENEHEYEFVLEEFSPPPEEETPMRVEISGVIAQDGFPASLAKFQLIRQKSEWLISGFFGENSKGIQPLTTEELARNKTVFFNFFDLAGRNMTEAYDATHEKFQETTTLNDFKRILSVLSLPLTTEPKCKYHFKTTNESLEEIDEVFVLKSCGVDDYKVELTLLKTGDKVIVGGLFVK